MRCMKSVGAYKDMIGLPKLSNLILGALYIPAILLYINHMTSNYIIIIHLLFIPTIYYLLIYCRLI